MSDNKIKRVIALGHEGRLKDALILCEEVISEQTETPPPFIIAAKLSMSLHLFAKAATYFEQHLRVAGPTRQTVLDPAYAWLLANQPHPALPLLEKLAAAAPSDEIISYLLGYARFLCSGQTVATVPHRGQSLKFFIGGGNVSVDMFLVAGKLFEADEIAHLESILPAAPQVIDVGANIGVHLVALAKTFPAGTFYPIEANPVTVEILRRNILLNELTGVRLEGLNKAATATASTVAVKAGRDLGRCAVTTGGDIEGVPLDQLISGPIDLIKIDVEGNEMAVLAGAEEIIRRSRPILMVEVESANDKPFSAWVQARGYRIERSFGHGTGKHNHILRGD